MPEPAHGGTHPHRGARAISRLVEFAPATGGLALWVCHRDVDDDGACDAAPVATDGRTLFYMPHFESLPLAEQTGHVAHEVLHVALQHVQRLHELRREFGEVDPMLFNACADAIVNSSLQPHGWLALPQGAVHLDALLAEALHIDERVEVALAQWDVVRLYRAVDDRRPTRAGSGQRQDGPRASAVRRLAGDSAADLVSHHDDSDGAPEQRPEARADEARAWQARLAQAHAADAESSLLRRVAADLAATRTPWQQVLRQQVARHLASRPTLSWSRPSRSYIAQQGRIGNRRMPMEPGLQLQPEQPRLVVVVDVSGSIDGEALARFGREIEALRRRHGAGLTLVVGDDRVRSVEVVKPGRAAFHGIECAGGGGTDFTPLLEEAMRHRPDLVIVLSDLAGPALTRPACPVLWAVPDSHRDAHAPFGRKLVID